MNLVPDIAVDDRVMLAGVAVALVDRLAEVGAVREQPVEILLVDPVAAWRREAACVDLACEDRAGSDLEEAGEDPAYNCGGFIVDQQLKTPYCRCAGPCGSDVPEFGTELR